MSINDREWYGHVDFYWSVVCGLSEDNDCWLLHYYRFERIIPSSYIWVRDDEKILVISLQTRCGKKQNVFIGMNKAIILHMFLFRTKSSFEASIGGISLRGYRAFVLINMKWFTYHRSRAEMNFFLKLSCRKNVTSNLTTCLIFLYLAFLSQFGFSCLIRDLTWKIYKEGRHKNELMTCMAEQTYRRLAHSLQLEYLLRKNKLLIGINAETLEPLADSLCRILTIQLSDRVFLLTLYHALILLCIISRGSFDFLLIYVIFQSKPAHAPQ